MFSGNKKSKKAQFYFIRVIFIALAFFLIFAFLAKTTSDSTEVFASNWGDEYPFLAWVISGINVWIFIGGLLGIVAGIVFRANITGD